jgi:hypothetical protein
MPAKAGIQYTLNPRVMHGRADFNSARLLGPRFRGDDDQASIDARRRVM